MRGPDVTAIEPSATSKRAGWLGPLYSLQHVLHKHASLGPLLVLALSARATPPPMDGYVPIGRLIDHYDWGPHNDRAIPGLRLRPRPDCMGPSCLCGRRRHRGCPTRRYSRSFLDHERLHGGGRDLWFCRLGPIGRVGSVSPDISSTLNLDSITAVVIGGTSLFGGAA